MIAPSFYAVQDQRRLEQASVRPKLDVSLKAQAAQLFRTVHIALARIASSIGLVYSSDVSEKGLDSQQDPEEPHTAPASVELLLTLDCIRDSDHALHSLMHRHEAIQQAVAHSGLYGQDPRLPQSELRGESAVSSSSGTARGPATRGRQKQDNSLKFPFARQLQLLADSAKRCTALAAQSLSDPEMRVMLSLHTALKAHGPSITQQQLHLGNDSKASCPSTRTGILNQLHRLLDTVCSYCTCQAAQPNPPSDWADVASGLNPAALSTTANPQKYIESVACDSRYPAVLRSLALASAHLMAATASVAAECPRVQTPHDTQALDEKAMADAVAQCFAATNSFLDAALSLELAADCKPLQQVVDHLSLAPSLSKQLLSSFFKSNDTGCSLGSVFGEFFESSTLSSPSDAVESSQLREALEMSHTAGFPSILCLASLRQLVLLRREALYSPRHSGATLQQCSSGCVAAVQLMHLSLSFVHCVGVVSIAGLNSDQRASEASRTSHEMSMEHGDSDDDHPLGTASGGAPKTPSSQGRPTPVLAGMSPTLTPMLTASASQSDQPTMHICTITSMPMVCTAQLMPAASGAGSIDMLPSIDLGAPAVSLESSNSPSSSPCDLSDVTGFLRTVMCTLQLLLDDTDYATGWKLQHETGATDKTSAVLATLHGQVRDEQLAPGGIAATGAKLVQVPSLLQLNTHRLDLLLSGLSLSTSGASQAPGSVSAHGTPLIASVKAEAGLVSLKQVDSDGEDSDAIAFPRRRAAPVSGDRAAAFEALLSWQLVFQRACAKTRTTVVSALRTSIWDALAAWKHACLAVYSTPLSIHGLVLKASAVLRSALSLSGVCPRVLQCPETPSVLQQSLSVLDSSASTELASQVLVSELPLSCHLDQPSRAGDLPGPLWTGVKVEDATILENLHTCMVWERAHSTAEVASQITCSGDLLMAIELRLTRPWLRLPEPPASPVSSRKTPESSGEYSPSAAMSSGGALSVLEHQVDIHAVSSPGALLAESWVSASPAGLKLPTTQSRVQAEALLWDSTRSGESITITAAGSIAAQRMPRSWGSAIGAKGFAPGTGIHKFDIQIKRCTSSNMFIGVATREASSSTFVGGDSHSWGMSSQSHTWHNRARQGFSGGFGRRFHPGTTVRVTVNTVTGEVSFGSPARSWGVIIQNAGHDSNGRMLELFPAVSLYSRGDEVRLRAVRDAPHAATDRAAMAQSLLGLNTDQSRLHKFMSRDDSSLYAMTGWRNGSDVRSRQRQQTVRSEPLRAPSWLPPAVSIHLAGQAAADTLCADEHCAVGQLPGSCLLLKSIQLRGTALTSQLTQGADPDTSSICKQSVELTQLLASIEFFLPRVCEPAWTEELCIILEEVCSTVASVLADRPIKSSITASALNHCQHNMSAVWQIAAEDKGGSSPHLFCLSLKQGVAGDVVGAASLSVSMLSAEARDRYGGMTGTVTGKVAGNSLEFTISWIQPSGYDDEASERQSSALRPVQYYRGCISADGSAAWLIKRCSKDDNKTERTFMSFLCPNDASGFRSSLGVVEQTDRWGSLESLKLACMSDISAAACSHLSTTMSTETRLSEPVLVGLLLSQVTRQEQQESCQDGMDFETCSFDELARYDLASFGELHPDPAIDASAQHLVQEVLGLPSAPGVLAAAARVLSRSPLRTLRRCLENGKQATISPLVADVLRQIQCPESTSGMGRSFSVDTEDGEETKEEQDSARELESAPAVPSAPDTPSAAIQVCMSFCRSPAASAGLLPEVSQALVHALLPEQRSAQQTAPAASFGQGGLQPLCSFFCGIGGFLLQQENAWLLLYKHLSELAMKGFANRITRRHLESPLMAQCVRSFVGVLLHHQGLAALASAAASNGALLRRIEATVLAPVWRQSMICALELRKAAVKSTDSGDTGAGISRSLKSAVENCKVLLLFASATLNRAEPTSAGEVDISAAFRAYLQTLESTTDEASIVAYPLRHFWATDVFPAIFAFCSSTAEHLSFQLLSSAASQTLRQHVRHSAVLRIQRLLSNDCFCRDWLAGVPDWLEPFLYHTCCWTTGHALVLDDASTNASLGSALGSIFTASPIHRSIVECLSELRHSFVGTLRHLTATSFLEHTDSSAGYARRHFAWPNAWECIVQLLMAFCVQAETPAVAAASLQSWGELDPPVGQSSAADNPDLQIRAILASLVWAQGLQASWAGHTQSAFAWCGIMQEIWKGSAFESVSGPCSVPIESARRHFGKIMTSLSGLQGIALPDTAGALMLQSHCEELVRTAATRVLTDQCEQALASLAQEKHIPHAVDDGYAAMSTKFNEACHVSPDIIQARVSALLKPVMTVSAALYKEVTRSKQIFRALDCRSSYADSVEKPDEIRDGWTEYKQIGFAAGALLPQPTASGQAVVSDLKSQAIEATLSALTASTAEWVLYKLLLSLHSSMSGTAVRMSMCEPAWCTVLWGCATCWVAPARLKQRAMRIIRSAIVSAPPSAADLGFGFACGSQDSSSAAATALERLSPNETQKTTGKAQTEPPSGHITVCVLLGSANALSPSPFSLEAPSRTITSDEGRGPKAAKRSVAACPGEVSSNTNNGEAHAAWKDFLASLSEDLLRVLSRVVTAPTSTSGLSAEQLAAAQVGTAAGCIALLRQLAGIAAWRPAVLHVFETALQDLAHVGLKQPDNGAAEAPVRGSTFESHNAVAQFLVDDLMCTKVSKGLAALAVMGGFRDILRPGVIARQVACSAWDLPGEDKLPTTSFSSKHGHTVFHEEPVWGADARSSCPQAPLVVSVSSLSLLHAAVRKFARANQDHIPALSSSVQVGGGCQLFPKTTHVHACLQASVIAAARDMYPGNSLFAGGEPCKAIGWQRVARPYSARYISDQLSSAFQSFSGFLPHSRPASPVSDMQRMFRDLCSLLRDEATGSNMHSFRECSSWQAILCCVGAVFSQASGTDSLSLGRVLCRPRPECALPQIQTPDMLGNFSYAGCAGVDTQNDLPPPQLGLGTIASLNSDGPADNEFLRSGAKCLVAARSGGPNSYLVSLPARLLSADNEIAASPSDFPLEMVKILSMSLLPHLLEHFLASGISGGSLSDTTLASVSAKKRARSPAHERQLSEKKKAGVVVDIEVLHSTLRVNVLRALSTLLHHPTHSDQLQLDITAQITSSNPTQPSTSLLAMLLSLARMPDQSITAHSLHLAEQGHTTVSLLLAAKQRQQRNQAREQNSALFISKGLSGSRALTTEAQAPSSAKASVSTSAPSQVDKRINLLEVLLSGELPESAHNGGLLGEFANVVALCPLELDEIHLETRQADSARPDSTNTDKTTLQPGQSAVLSSAPPKTPSIGPQRVLLDEWAAGGEFSGEGESADQESDQLDDEDDMEGGDEDEEGVLLGEDYEFGDDDSGDGESEEQEDEELGFGSGLFGIGSMPLGTSSADFMDVIRQMAGRSRPSDAGSLGAAAAGDELARADSAGSLPRSAEQHRSADSQTDNDSVSSSRRGQVAQLPPSSQRAADEHDAADAGPSPECSMMIDMGFKREWCELALRRTGGNVEMACNFIFENMPVMDTLVDALQDRQQRAGAAGGGAAANSMLIAEVGAALQEVGFPEIWSERCIERSKATTLQEALGWAVANFEALQREDSLGAPQPDSVATGADEDALPTVKLGYTPGQKPNEPFTSDEAKGLPARLCTVLSGNAEVSSSLQVAVNPRPMMHDSTFPTIRLSPLRITSGKWYYEVIVRGSGLLQIGWCNDLFSGNAFAGLGVGDDLHSWAWDGHRTKLWHDGSSDWGSKWSDGDVVCCCIDMDNSRMHWGLNGSYATPMGLGFAGFQSQGGMFPALTLQSGSKCQLRLGELNRPFLCGPPPGFRPILEAASSNQKLPREEPHSARRCACPVDHSPDQMLFSNQCLEKNHEVAAAEGGAMYSSSSAWRKRHFSSGRVGHTAKVLSGAVGIGGGMRRSRNSPISADSGPVRTAPVRIAPGVSYTGASSSEVASLMKLSSEDLRRAHINLSAGLSVIYARKIVVGMLALFQPAGSSVNGPLLSIVDMIEQGGSADTAKCFASLTAWMSWTSVSMLPIEIAQLAQAAALAPAHRAARAHLSQIESQQSWNFHLENPVNSQGISAAVQHVVTSGSQNFAGAAGTELARLPNGINLCAVAEPSLLSALMQRTFFIKTGLYSRKSLSPVLKTLVKLLKSSLVNPPADSTRWPSLKAPGSAFDPPAINGTWSGSFVRQKHNLGGIQWLFSLLMTVAVHQRTCAPQVDENKPLGTLFSGRKVHIKGAMGSSSVFQKDEEVLLAFSRELALHKTRTSATALFLAYPITLELFSALCTGAQSGNDTFKAAVFGMLAGLCDELLRDLLACEAMLQEVQQPAPGSSHLGARLLEVLHAHTSLLTLDSMGLWLAIRLEGERPAEIGSLACGAAVELHASLFGLQSNMQRLRVEWLGPERDAHIAAALASSVDSFAFTPALDCSETKEEEDSETHAVSGDGSVQRPPQEQSDLTSEEEANSIVSRSILHASIDDGLPGRTQHASYLPILPREGAGMDSAPWRSIACGAGDSLGPNCQGAFAPGFVCKHPQNGQLEMTSGMHQWTGSFVTHTPTNDPVLSWDRKLPKQSGLRPGMRLEVISEMAELPGVGSRVTVASISFTEEAGVLLHLSWRTETEDQETRLSFEEDFERLCQAVLAFEDDGEEPVSFAQGGGFAIDPKWAADHKIPCPWVPLSFSKQNAPTRIGSGGAILRLSIVPHESSAPGGAANTLAMRSFNQEDQSGPLKRTRGLRVAGTIELPEYGGAVVGVEGFWVCIEHSHEQDKTRKTARSDAATNPQSQERQSAADSTNKPSVTSAWRIELREVELLTGLHEKGWHSRFGHDWYAPGTEWFSTLVEEPILSRHSSHEGASPTLVSVQWPRIIAFGCDSHFSVNGKAHSHSCALVLQSEFLFRWDNTALGRGAKTNTVKTLVEGAPGMSSRSLALGTVGFCRGIHYWEVQVVRALEPGTILIGVAEKPDSSNQTLESSLSTWSNHCWGITTNRLLVHPGLQQPFGETLNPGDVIGVRLDADKGKLGFFLDGMQFGEHMIRDLGEAFDTLRAPNCTSSAPRVLYPCVGLRHYTDCVRLLPAHVSLPRVSFGTGLLATSSARPAQLLLGSAPLLANQEQVRSKRSGQLSIGSRLIDVEAFSSILRNWEHPQVFQRVHKMLSAMEARALKASRAAGVKRRRADPDGESSTQHSQQEQSGDSALDPSDESIAKFFVGSWGRAAALEADPQRMYLSRAGVLISLDRTQSSLDRLVASHGHNLPIKIDDLLQLNFSYERELQVPEKVQILGTHGGQIWYRPVSAPQGSDGAAQGFKLAWCLPGGILQLLSGRPLDEFVERSEPVSSSQFTAADLGSILRSPAQLAACSVWPERVDAQHRSAADKWLVAVINDACNRTDSDPEQLVPSHLAYALKHSAGPPSALVVAGGLNVPFATGRALALIELSLLCERVLPWLPLGPQHEPGARSVGADIASAVSAAHAHASLMHHLRRPLPGIATATTQPRIWRPSTLSGRVRHMRSLLLKRSKLRLWHSILHTTTHPTMPSIEAFEDPREIQTLRISRGPKTKPERLAKMSKSEARLRTSITGQLMEALSQLSDSSLRRSYIGKGHGGQARAFLVKLLGEGADDYGGPYRALFESVADELQADVVPVSGGSASLLPVLTPCSNRQIAAKTDTTQHLPSTEGFQPSEEQLASSVYGREAFAFVGRLAGIAMRHGINMPIALVPHVLKQLVRSPLQQTDAEQANCRVSLASLLPAGFDRVPDSSDADACARFDATLKAEGRVFSVEVVPGVARELVHKGLSVAVNALNFSDFVGLAQAAALAYARDQTASLAQGMSAVIPYDLLPIWSPSELDELLGGKADVSVSSLQAMTEYSDGLSGDEQHVQWMWQVLEEGAPCDRIAFLRFVAARSRLPSSVQFLPTGLSVSSPKAPEVGQLPLPEAKTCFMTFTLPRYRSKDELRSKLFLAIHHSPNMDADVLLHSAEGWADI